MASRTQILQSLLDAAPTPMTRRALEDAVGPSPTEFDGHVDELERLGMVRRTPDPQGRGHDHDLLEAT